MENDYSDVGGRTSIHFSSFQIAKNVPRKARSKIRKPESRLHNGLRIFKDVLSVEPAALLQQKRFVDCVIVVEKGSGPRHRRL